MTGKDSLTENGQALKQSPQGNDNSPKLLELKENLDNTLRLRVWILCCPVWSRELDLMILVGPSQLFPLRSSDQVLVPMHHAVMHQACFWRGQSHLHPWHWDLQGKLTFLEQRQYISGKKWASKKCRKSFWWKTFSCQALIFRQHAYWRCSLCLYFVHVTGGSVQSEPIPAPDLCCPRLWGLGRQLRLCLSGQHIWGLRVGAAEGFLLPLSVMLWCGGNELLACAAPCICTRVLSTVGTKCWHGLLFLFFSPFFSHFPHFFPSLPSWFSQQNDSNRRARTGLGQNRASTACAAEQWNREALFATASKCFILFLFKRTTKPNNRFSIFLFLCSLALATRGCCMGC